MCILDYDSEFRGLLNHLVTYICSLSALPSSIFYNYTVNRIYTYYVTDETLGITVIIYTCMCLLHNYVDNYNIESQGYIISTHAVALMIQFSVLLILELAIVLKFTGNIAALMQIEVSW